MNDKSLIRTGILGSAVFAICCFTPALVILLGAVGLSAWLAWLDFILLPALVICLAILGFVLVRRLNRRDLKPEAGDA
ncbi:MAG: mercury resistance system transport protein MerF [Rhodospirillales bacterium]|nr:mercury resistance system transport protein MerF [Rhodospirillales bacterium]